MEPDHRFERVLRSHATLLGPDEPLDVGKTLTSLGVDSLGFVQLLLELEDAYGVSLPDEVLTPATFDTPASLWAAFASVQYDCGESS